MFGGAGGDPNLDTSSFTKAELDAVKRAKDFIETGRGYIEIQSTKVKIRRFLGHDTLFTLLSAFHDWYLNRQLSSIFAHLHWRENVCVV